MNEVKTRMYLNALKVVFPYDNKVIGKLISREKSQSDEENLTNQTSEICSQWLSHVFHRAGTSELLSLGLTAVQAHTLLDKRASVNPEAEYALLLQEQVSLIGRNDDDYPKLLRELPDAPEILYAQGRKSMLVNQKKDWNIAIVGTRTPSAYGREITSRIVRDLVSYNPKVVSGLAMGIDQAAHESAIEHGLPTIAVLGGGHGSLKPKYGLRLIKQLLDENLIVTEYPYNAKADKFTFPMRNRIICGMSLATIVVEARSRSGALITARLAADYNRIVFAVPGSILSSYSAGTNGIIQTSEAELFMDVPTMIESLNLSAQLKFKETRGFEQIKSPKKKPEKIKPQIQNPVLKKLFDSLKYPMDISELMSCVNMNIREVLIALTELEMQGMIKETPDQRWVRTI